MYTLIKGFFEPVASFQRRLMKPLLGLPRYVHAMAPTMGGVMNGTRAVRFKTPLNGVSVRATIQAIGTPTRIETRAVPTAITAVL